MNDLIINIIGWIGTFLIVLAYFLISNKHVQGNSRSYQFLNVFGAIGILVNAYWFGAIPSVGLQIIWILIALKSLIFSSKK